MYPNVQGSQVFLPRSRILARLVLSIWPGLHMQHRKFADIRWLFREDVLPDDNARPNNIFLPELGSNYFSAFLKRLLYQFRPTLLLGGPRLHGARGWCRMIRILRQAMTRLRNKNHNLTCSDTKLSRNDVKSHFKYIWSNQMVLLTKKMKHL